MAFAQRLLGTSICLVLMMPASTASAHGGGLDSSGGHHDRKNGGYHYHRRSYSPAPPTSPPKARPTPKPSQAKPRPTPPAEPILHGHDEGCTYVVGPGDGFDLIAKLHGLDHDTLQELNHLDNPDVIEVGQYLQVSTDCVEVTTTPEVLRTASMNPHEPNPAGDLLGSLCCLGFTGGPLLAMLLFVVLADRRKTLRKKQRLAEAEAALGEMLESWQDGAYRDQFVESMQAAGTRHFRPKKKEHIIAVFPAGMAQMTRETKAYQYGGLSMSLKLWGPVKYRAGSMKVMRVTRDRLKIKGRGALVVTNKRIHFDNAGHGSDWSRTWNSIANWGMYSDAVQVELTNGKPLVFLLDPMVASTHPGFVSAVFEYAHDST